MEKKRVKSLIVGVPGSLFLIAGIVNRDYVVAVLGGVMVIVFGYAFIRRRMVFGPGDHAHERLSLVLAGVIGVSLTVNGFASSRFWLAAAGVVLVIGALVRLYLADSKKPQSE
jgi:hypothetical protein